MTRDEILAKVRATLVEALSVDEEEVTEDAFLRKDLGAESIDFLDIVFRLEKTFGIKIAQDELIPRDIVQNPQFVAAGRLNEDGLAALNRAMPHADLSAFSSNPRIDDLPDVFTVGTIVSFVQSKLGK
ncbi:MAG: acyl carrier protein [Phycisphaerales bacterium]|nr:acyl carrier protein [Phycisphaerales bacterium]